jgi:hypothetical protein
MSDPTDDIEAPDDELDDDLEAHPDDDVEDSGRLLHRRHPDRQHRQAVSQEAPCAEGAAPAHREQRRPGVSARSVRFQQCV